MDTNELVGELLQSLIEEVKALQLKLGKLPTETPPDYRASIDALTKAVQGLQSQASSARHRSESGHQPTRPTRTDESSVT